MRKDRRIDGQACKRCSIGIRQMHKWIISIVINEETLANPGITVKRIQPATTARLPCRITIENKLGQQNFNNFENLLPHIVLEFYVKRI